MKQSIILHLNQLAASFNFSKFHPTLSDSSSRTHLELLYHEHYFWESSPSMNFVETLTQNSSWDDATLTINDVIQSVDVFNRREKILLLGKRGCGMSTALLRAAVSQSEIGFYDFILFLDETCVEFKPEQESFMISFGKQTVSLFEFCSIYGKYTIIIFDNVETFPLNSMEILTNNENLRDTTILCSFQSNVHSPTIPVKLFDRFYTSGGFSVNNFKSIGRKMLGSFWTESFFHEIQKKLSYDNDVMSLSVITALVNRNHNLGNSFSLDDCYEKYIHFMITEKLKKEQPRKQAPISADEIAKYSVSLQESAISRYAESRSYSDKELLSELSLTLRLFLIKQHLKSLKRPTEKKNVLESLELLCPRLSRDVSNMLEEKKQAQSKLVLLSNKQLKEFFQASQSHNSTISQILISLKEIFFTVEEISSWQQNGSKVESFQIRIENLAPAKLTSILEKFADIAQLSLSFRNVSGQYIQNTSNSSIPIEYLIPNFPYLSLRQLTLHDIPCQLILDNFSNILTGSSSKFNLNKIVFKRLNIDFGHVYLLKEFERNLAELAKKVSNFALEIQNCTFNVNGINRNIGLVVLGTFASDIETDDLMSISHDEKYSFYAAFKHDSLDNLILEFNDGMLDEISISGTIISQSCSDSAEICKHLKFKPFSSKLDCSNMNIMCKNARCFNCSSLLLLQGICQTGDSSLKTHHMTRIIDFGPKNFLHENVTFLTENLSPSLSKTNSNRITVKFAGLTFGSDATKIETSSVETFGLKNTKSPDSVSSLTKLKSQNVVFELETIKERLASVESDDESMIVCPDESHCEVLDIEVDNTGWGFTRFNLTQDPITVCFSNGVTIEWPPNSTVESRSRLLKFLRLLQSKIRQLWFNFGLLG